MFRWVLVSWSENRDKDSLHRPVRPYPPHNLQNRNVMMTASEWWPSESEQAKPLFPRPGNNMMCPFVPASGEELAVVFMGVVGLPRE